MIFFLKKLINVIKMGNDLTKNERRQLKLQEKRDAKVSMHGQEIKKEKSNKMLLYAGIALAIIILLVIFLNLPRTEPVDLVTGNLSFPLGNIHWHATPMVYICGENVPTPISTPGRHLGSNLLHTHDDRLAHIEGNVSSPEQITIGAFMANIGLRFSETDLVDKKNGDSCPNGEAGTVKLLVNGVENSQLANYVLRDGDNLEMRFE